MPIINVYLSNKVSVGVSVSVNVMHLSCNFILNYILYIRQNKLLNSALYALVYTKLLTD
jgi:hypothetical protein